MKNRFFININQALLVAVTLLTFACSSTDIKESSDPEKVYGEGERLLKQRDFLIAEEYFSEVRRRFPQSRFAVLSQLATADLEYEQDNFLEAATIYGLFVDQYPRHEKAAYAQYRKADSFFKAAPEKVARDQAQVVEAISASRDFLKKFPTSPLGEKVKVILLEGRLRLAQKEAYVAAFYERKEKNVAALRRWRNLQSDYADIAATADGAALIQRAEDRSARLEKAVEKE
jgi:outer membrane protein assembly factor BamD